MAPPEFVVEQVELNHDTYKAFRQFVSKVTGRGLSIPENNDVFFGYQVYLGGIKKVLLSVGTCRPALASATHSSPHTEVLGSASALSVDSCSDDLASLNLTGESDSSRESARSGPTDNFLDDSSHVIEYLFTDVYYRGSGFGNKILKAMELHCHQLNPSAPFKLWAASKARHFFQQRHYLLVSESPSESYHAVQIFRHLYPMIKVANKVDLPPLPRSTHQNKRKRRNKNKTRISSNPLPV